MSTRFWLCIAVCAGVTYLIRMLPMVLCKKEIRNPHILTFLHYVPYSVLAVMTFPAVFYSTSYVLSAAVGVAVALILSYFDRSMILVAMCSCAAVFVTELLMSLAG